MDLMYIRILENAPLSPGETGDASKALDCGHFDKVYLVITVHSAGEGEAPKLCIKHSAVTQGGTWLDFETACEVSLTTTGTSWFPVNAFTRYLCWFISGTLNSAATVTVDLVAKR